MTQPDITIQAKFVTTFRIRGTRGRDSITRTRKPGPIKKKKKSISFSDPNTVILKVKFESLYVFLVKITNDLDQGCLQSLLNKHQKEK